LASMRRRAFIFFMILVSTAEAQISVPRLPALPQVPLTSAVAQDARTDLRRLQDVRRLAVRDLITRNRTVIQADRNGAAIVRGEIVAVSPEQGVIDAAVAAGFTVVRTRVLEGLDAQVVVLGVPHGMDTLHALDELRSLAPSTQFDLNHIYTSSGGEVHSAPMQTRVPSTLGKLGLIDSGVDVAHPVFKDVLTHQHGCSAPVPEAHGTAVASLMVASGGELYAADVYCGAPTGGAADAVAEAFSWLAHEHVPVINVSLVGPPNVTLETVVRLVIARGHLVVAAVGNDGPAAAPLYPASYPGVVGVTGVDAHRRVLFEAGRGPQVRFAAPGADISAAKSAHTYEVVRGTSFAAPIVAGLLAARLAAPDPTGAQRAMEELAQEAIDLGAPGPDPVYGLGLVGADYGKSK
jgi:hypothetical protein